LFSGFFRVQPTTNLTISGFQNKAAIAGCMRANDGLTPGGEAMSLPKATAILPRTNNPLKAKVAKASKPPTIASRPAHDLPEIAFPTSHDLKHAMLAFARCYGCNRLFPDAGLRLDCESCGARMCSDCDTRRRKCSCKQISKALSSDKFGEGATLMLGVTDSPPSDAQQYTVSNDGCLFLWV
jgi:hypothetical protein